MIKEKGVSVIQNLQTSCRLKLTARIFSCKDIGTNLELPSNSHCDDKIYNRKMYKIDIGIIITIGIHDPLLLNGQYLSRIVCIAFSVL